MNITGLFYGCVHGYAKPTRFTDKISRVWSEEVHTVESEAAWCVAVTGTPGTPDWTFGEDVAVGVGGGDDTEPGPVPARIVATTASSPFFVFFL